MAEPDKACKLMCLSRCSTGLRVGSVFGGGSGMEEGDGGFGFGSSKTRRKKRPLHLWPGMKVSLQL